MKFKVTAFKTEESSVAFPPELCRGRDVVLTSCATLLQMHGIDYINLNATMVGPKAVTSPEISLADANPPEIVTKVQSVIAKHVSEILLTYGIIELRLIPEDKEIAAMSKRWRYMSEGE